MCNDTKNKSSERVFSEILHLPCSGSSKIPVRDCSNPGWNVAQPYGDPLGFGNFKWIFRFLTNFERSQNFSEVFSRKSVCNDTNKYPSEQVFNEIITRQWMGGSKIPESDDSKPGRNPAGTWSSPIVIHWNLEILSGFSDF